MGANSLCKLVGCNKTPKTTLGFCSRSHAQQGRRAIERRAVVTCARDGCSRSVGGRQMRYCSKDCRKVAERYTNRCCDCAFRIGRKAKRCLSCHNEHQTVARQGYVTPPEVRAKMREKACDRYAARRGGVRWTDEVCAEIRRRYEAGEKQAALARSYRACQATIWAIVTFGSWAAYRDFKRKQGAC